MCLKQNTDISKKNTELSHTWTGNFNIGESACRKNAPVKVYSVFNYFSMK